MAIHNQNGIITYVEILFTRPVDDTHASVLLFLYFYTGLERIPLEYTDGRIGHKAKTMDESY